MGVKQILQVGGITLAGYKFNAKIVGQHQIINQPRKRLVDPGIHAMRKRAICVMPNGMTASVSGDVSVPSVGISLPTKAAEHGIIALAVEQRL